MTCLEKKLNKRWGKKFEDHRDWPVYNEQLVKRSECLIDLDWVIGWNDELENMNENKRGHPYQFPNSLIRLQVVWHVKEIAYRMIEGITRKLVEISDLPAYNHCSTVNRRVNRLDVHLEIPPGSVIEVGFDT